jgi:chaperone BCS1
LDQQPAWGRSREFDITTRSLTRAGIIQNTAGDLEEGDEDETLVHGKKKRKVTFIPSIGKLFENREHVND